MRKPPKQVDTESYGTFLFYCLLLHW